MKYRIASDLHTEFFNIDEIEEVTLEMLPELEGDCDTTLILAGDIGSMHKPANISVFIDTIAPRFKQVLYIPGNHEYYGGNLETTGDKIKSLIAAHSNVFFTECGRHVDVHMATLWTDFDDGDPKTMLEAECRMNDYRMIHNGDRIAEPKDMMEIHNRTVANFETEITEGNIVITHHMPSHRSVPQEFKDQGRINGAYASNLDWLILKTRPDVFVHGHTHNACDYMIGNTRILCNPRGYGNQYKKNGYNNKLVIEM